MLTTVAIAFFTSLLFVTSHFIIDANLAISWGVLFILLILFSKRTTSEPCLRNSLAIDKPIAPQPPLITVTFPVKIALVAFFSLACSNGQYSTLKISLSGMDVNFPNDSALEIISTVASAKSPAIIASFFDRPIATMPNFGI